MPLAAAAPQAGSRKRPRPPAAVQELLDALLELQGHFTAPSKAAAAATASNGAARAERAALLAWFGGLSLLERRRVLCIEEPAFTRLLQLMARKAQARAEYQGQQRGNALLARFIVFAEGVPALGPAPPPASSSSAAGGKRGGRGGGGGGRKEGAMPGSVDLELLGDEPFILRPDSRGRTTAWGDALAPLAAVGAETEAAWAALTEHLLLLPSPDATATPAAAAFSSALLADTRALVRTLEAASGGAFLQQPVEGEQCQAFFGETPWFRAKGEYSLGELLANKAELLLWRAWRAHHQQQQKSAPVLPPVLAAHVEETAALSAFLFQDLGGSLAERRACLAGAFAKAVSGALKGEKEGAVMGQLQGLVAALGLLDRYQPLLLRSAPADARDGALELLLALPLSRAAGRRAVEWAVQCRLVAELKERRTAWHQRQLLALLEAGGDAGVVGGQQQHSKAAKKKKKRKQQQQQQQQEKARLEAADEQPLPEPEPEPEPKPKPEQEDEKQGVPASTALAAEDELEALDALKEESMGVKRQDTATQTEEEEQVEQEQQPASDSPAEPESEPEPEPEDDEKHEQGARASTGRRASGSQDYWEGEDTVVEDEDQDTFCTSMAPAPPLEEPGPPVPTETLLRDLCLKLEAEVATLRGVLATQRGLVVAAQQRPSAAPAPAPAAYPSPYTHLGPASSFAHGAYGSYHLPSTTHSLSHHLEIMSDDGRGGRGGVAWAGLQRAHTHSSFAHPSHLAPPPPMPGATTETAAPPTTTGSVYSAESAGAGYGHSPQPHRVQAGAPAVSLPRNPSGPLQAQAQGWAAPAPLARLPPTTAAASSSLRPLLPQQQQPADEAGLPTAGAATGLAGGPVDECSGFVLERRRPQLPVRSRLCDDIAAFVGMVGGLTGAALREQSLAITRCRQVVQSLWPRAQVKAYGSFVTGLALPSSDVDLVICLPKVRKDAPAEAPGVLEGRNAIKETWQQELARRLRATPWVHPGSIRIIPHTAIPVIKLKALSARLGTGTGGGAAVPALVDRLPSPVGGEAGGPEAQAAAEAEAGAAAEEGVQLDVSIEGGQHNGLLANRVIADLLRESPALRPLVLVLKQFLKERGLMESYSGGLSSYGLVLMVARYLQEQSGAPMDTGSLLLGFLDFYSNHFDPRTMGISVSRRCFFSRDSQQLQAATGGMHPHHAVAAVAAAAHRRGSLGGDGGPELAYYEQQLGARRHSLVGMAGGPGGNQNGGTLENPYRFDPLYIEDPISPGSNVGRNCFRVFQIQRAWNDAWRALDPAASAGVRPWQPPVAPPREEEERDGNGEEGAGAVGARRPHPSSLPLLGRVLCSL